MLVAVTWRFSYLACSQMLLKSTSAAKTRLWSFGIPCYKIVQQIKFHRYENEWIFYFTLKSDIEFLNLLHNSSLSLAINSLTIHVFLSLELYRSETIDYSLVRFPINFSNIYNIVYNFCTSIACEYYLEHDFFWRNIVLNIFSMKMRKLVHMICTYNTFNGFVLCTFYECKILESDAGIL